MVDLYKIYQGLRKNSNTDYETILVENVPDRTKHKIGLSKDNLPVFFISANNSITKALDINLKLIQVSFFKDCELISKEGKKSNGIYTIISLKSDSEDMIKYFINTVFFLINQLDLNPSFEQIKSEIHNLVNLFQSLSKPSKKTIQGLWTELLFIDQSNDIEYVIKSWHQNKNDRYDFNDGIDKVEIKSTRKSERIHRFSLSQLEEINNTMSIIGSTLVIETDNGLCANDLIESIKKKVSNSSLMYKIHNVVADTIGEKFEQIFDVYYDYNFSLNSIRYFNASIVPKINQIVPNEISNVKYDCHLGNIEFIEKNDNKSKLLKALF